MDDNFNTNNVFGNNAPESAPAPQETPASQQAPAQQPRQSAPQMGSAPGSNNYNYGSPYYNQSPYSTPYNTPYNTQPNPYAQQMPYNPGNNQYSNSPRYNTAYPNPNSPTPKKKKNPGRNIFVALICACIVIASVAIGISVTDDKDNNIKTEQGDKGSDKNNKDKNKNNSSGAAAKTEDSPITFSEYSGKGAMTPEQIYEEAKEINVAVIVYAQNQKVGEGSGIIVGEDTEKKNTYIITAAHVIADQGVSVQIQTHDGKEYDADIVGFDAKTDIGVLIVNKTGFKAATFGNSDKLNVGQKVYAIGNPGGTVFFGSFTNGIISAIDRPVASSTSAYDLPCIQHNAAINPGNSGGALLNEYGQVIGLNSSKITDTDYEGMGFSVPSNTMLEIYTDIAKNGYVTNRPMLGISYYTVASDYTYSAIAWKNNLPYGSIVIAAMTEDSYLAKQGIKVGDIVTAVNGKPLDSTDILLEVIENSQVGDTITLSVCRLTNSGTLSNKFDATVKLIEDKGETAIPQQEPQTTDPFSSYFGNGFGY